MTDISEILIEAQNSAVPLTYSTSKEVIRLIHEVFPVKGIMVEYETIRGVNFRKKEIVFVSCTRPKRLQHGWDSSYLFINYHTNLDTKKYEKAMASIPLFLGNEENPKPTQYALIRSDKDKIGIYFHEHLVHKVLLIPGIIPEKSID